MPESREKNIHAKQLAESDIYLSFNNIIRFYMKFALLYSTLVQINQTISVSQGRE